MNSFSRIPQRGLERLSAYLDGALSTREAARMEARLREDPALQKALEELRHTSVLLRSLPMARVPRNFTITPQMVGQAVRRPAYPALRLATALASLALVLMVGFDALSGTLLQGAQAPLAAYREVPAAEVAEKAPMEGAEMPAEAPMPEPEMPVEAPMAEPEMLAEAPAPAEEAPLGALAAGEGEAIIEEQEAPMEEEAPKYAAEAEDTLSGEVATPELVEATPSETQAADEARGVSPTVSAFALEGQTDEAGNALDKATTEELPHATPALTEPEAMPETLPSVSHEPRPSFWSPLRILELALAIVVAGLATMTLWVRKMGP